MNHKYLIYIFFDQMFYFFMWKFGSYILSYTKILDRVYMLNEYICRT